MTGHISAQRIESYQRGKLAPADLLSVGEHLAQCAACRDQMSSTDHLRKASLAVTTGLQAAADDGPIHLNAADMAAYVDNQLGETDRTIAESHLEICPECRMEILDLRELNAVIPGLSAHETGSITAPSQRISFRARLLPWVRWLPVPAAALIVLLFVLLLVIPLRKQASQLSRQLRELQETNNALEARIASLSATRDLPGVPHGANGEEQISSRPLVAALSDGGGIVTLDKQGLLTGLRLANPAHEQLIRKALTGQRVEVAPVLADLIPKRNVLMGRATGNNVFSLISPIGTSIESDRPAFRWRPLPGATRYIVTLYNSVTKEMTASPPLTTTEWIAANALERGVTYGWEVTATRDGREFTAPIVPIPQAKFLVLNQSKVDELNQARQKYPGSHLVLGLLYAEAGLQYAAEQEFEALVAANPDSRTAERLLHSVRARRKGESKASRSK